MYKNYFLIVAGTFILTFGVYNIHAQTQLTEGGVLGLILLLRYWFNINPSISSIIIDYALMLAGHFVIKGKFLLYSLFSSLCFSVFYYVLSNFDPVFNDIIKNDLLSAVFGGLFIGVGVGIVVRVGGACGGDDSLALIMSKKFNIKISTAYLITDYTVLLLSLSYISMSKIIYSIITVTISSYLIEIIKKKRLPVFNKAN